MWSRMQGSLRRDAQTLHPLLLPPDPTRNPAASVSSGAAVINSGR